MAAGIKQAKNDATRAQANATSESRLSKTAEKPANHPPVATAIAKNRRLISDPRARVTTATPRARTATAVNRVARARPFEATGPI